MSVNGVTNNYGTAPAYEANQNSKTNNSTSSSEKAAESTAQNDSGVVYEPSSAAASATTKKYKPDAEAISRLQKDLEVRQNQLLDLVHKMLNGQAKTYGTANSGSIWDTLRTGNFTVDEDTRLQAQADIGEDGYWGVSQTSDRILDFATALTGGDPDKIEEMRSAFEKGFKMAEKTWGGKLPDISQKTYDAVMAGFDKLAEGSAAKAE